MIDAEEIMAHRYAQYFDGSDSAVDEFHRFLADIKAEAWDEGYSSAEHNEHEHRPGRKIDNPYKEQE